MYRVEFSKIAKKQLDKLENNLEKRIVTVLERISIRPFSHTKRLIGTKYFRLRVGEYRVILDIKQNELIILVIELGHRRKIYKG